MSRETSFPAGALPVVLAFLDHGREEAQVACQVLARLCFYDLSSQLLEMLARLQGIRRLSNILCTVKASKAHMKATGRASSFILIFCSPGPLHMLTFRPLCQENYQSHAVMILLKLIVGEAASCLVHEQSSLSHCNSHSQ